MNSKQAIASTSMYLYKTTKDQERRIQHIKVSDSMFKREQSGAID